MPKIIENLYDKIIEEAKRQVEKNGYKRTTIRSVAKGCDIAVGTVYNYFSSKETLVASFMLSDWQNLAEKVKKADKSSPEGFLRYVYDCIFEFEKSHAFLFSDPDAEKVFTLTFSQKHKLLRNQLAELILPVFKGEDEFLSRAVSEILLSFSAEGEKFDIVYTAISPLIDASGKD